jgi:uncharacterized protein YbaR (Trm112 family)
MQVSCTQCGAGVPLPEGALFLVCPFCQSALYVDKSRTVFHYVVSPTIKTEDAQGKLKRWMAGNETVKDLDVHAVIGSCEMLYFPMWRFVTKDGNEQKDYCEMASSFAISEVKTIPLSGGNLKFFSPQEFEGIPMRDPDVLLDSALQWLKDQEGVTSDKVTETDLIHIPFYLFRYQYKNKPYQAIVDGVSGRVLASIYPAKDEIPFIGIAILAGLVFFVAGLIASGFLIRLGLYLLIAIPFAAVSYTVVKKF